MWFGFQKLDQKASDLLLVTVHCVPAAPWYSPSSRPQLPCCCNRPNFNKERDVNWLTFLYSSNPPTLPHVLLKSRPMSLLSHSLTKLLTTIKKGTLTTLRSCVTIYCVSNKRAFAALFYVPNNTLCSEKNVASFYVIKSKKDQSKKINRNIAVFSVLES